MNRPLVSIAVPTRNRAHLLRKTLPTILAQTYAPLEILISDNASTDDTEAVCSTAALADSRVRYVRHTSDIGIHGNHNYCIDNTCGELLAFCHDDDLYSPSIVAESAEFLQRQKNVGFVCPDWNLIDEHDRWVGERIFDGLEVTPGLEYIERTIASGRSSACLPGTLFRRCALGSSRLPETGPLGFADFVLCFEIAERWDVGHIQRTLWSYRQHSSALSRRKIEQTVEHFVTNLDRYISEHLARWPPRTREVERWRSLATRYAFWALVYELCLHARPKNVRPTSDEYRSVFELADYRLSTTELIATRAAARRFAHTRAQQLSLTMIEKLLEHGLHAPLIWASRHLALARTLLRAK